MEGKVTKKKKWDLIANWQYYSMVLPALALFFSFAYLSLPGVVLAFKKYDASATSILGGTWVGFENFRTFFQSPKFSQLLTNTFLINITNLVLGTGSSIGFALLINELNFAKAKKVYQNILFLPTFFSVLLVARFLSLLLGNENGVVNVLLNTLGLNSIPFYDTGGPWILIVVLTYIWKGVGYGLIVYLAVMSGFDREIYEAAYIDGAGRIKQMMKITLPLLVPTLIILVLMNIGRIFFGDFQLIYAIAGTTNTVLLSRLDIIETYLFRMVTGAVPDYGLAGAVGLFQTMLGFVMLFGSNAAIKLYNKDYALF